MKKNEKEIYQNKMLQLHNATLQFSKNTLEIKKLFATVVIGFFTITTGLPKNIAIEKQILILIVLTVLFWVLDAQSYYYQKKLRKQMEALENKILGKKEDNICSVCKYYNIKNYFKSIFNASMFIYYMGIIGLVLMYYLRKKGIVL